MRKTICLVTNWYPTKENVFQGQFFKEQAFAVSEDFDFVVIHFQEHYRKNPFDKTKFSTCHKEKNTIEYTFNLAVPLTLFLFDAVETFNTIYLKRKKIDGVGQYISKKRKHYIKKTQTSLIKRFVKEEIDVFYCIDAQREAFSVQCLAESFKKPYIVSEHAPVPWPGTLINDSNKYAIEKANGFLAISNDKIRQLMLQNIVLPKTTYIGNLVDETKFVCKQTNSSTKTIIAVAAHSYYKNYDLFISVMNRLTEITVCDFKVMIVGYASNKGYSKDVDVFEKKIKQSKFADKAIMIPSVPHEQIGEILNKADAFVMTSIQEGQPVSALEAACCGLPIFSTRCGGIEDYVDDKMGRIFDVLDYEGMAQTLKDYVEGRIVFDSKYIRDRTVNSFGTKAFCEKFKDVFYREVENAQN